MSDLVLDFADGGLFRPDLKRVFETLGVGFSPFLRFLGEIVLYITSFPLPLS